MKPMYLHELTDSPAEQYLLYFRNTGDRWIQELSHQLLLTGGPLEAMDGSFDSLIPLWEWFLAQADKEFPSVDDSRVSSLSIVLDRSMVSKRHLRSDFLVEAIQQYLFFVLREFAPDAHWALFPVQHPDDDTKNRLSVISERWDAFIIDHTAWALSKRAARGEPLPLLKTALLDRVVQLTGIDLSQTSPVNSRIGVGIRAGSYTDASELYVGLPMAERSIYPDPHSDRRNMIVEDHLFADIDAMPEHLESSPPLDAKAVAYWFEQIGAHMDGPAAKASDLIGGNVQLMVRDRVALIETLAAGGELRAFSIEPLHLSEKEWSKLCSSARRLAAANNAYFGPEAGFLRSGL